MIDIIRVYGNVDIGVVMYMLCGCILMCFDKGFFIGCFVDGIEV